MDCTCTTDDHDFFCIDGMGPVPQDETLADANETL